MNRSAGFSICPKKNQCHQASAKRGVRSCEVLANRYAVKHRELCHRLGLVERETVCDGGAAVVADDSEPPMPEPTHQFDDVRSHRALRRL